jgi:hypothetical protein
MQVMMQRDTLTQPSYAKQLNLQHQQQADQHAVAQVGASAACTHVWAVQVAPPLNMDAAIPAGTSNKQGQCDETPDPTAAPMQQQGLCCG